ncbi:hypothetical protein Zmor_007406 [Zophobas morio]|uniref:Uncharacterized protein n=1 Tax=Zophobas morio TaxID=2755281 RepID=A0AA38MPE4_9CUCU|nr:hypothetical protein Zmor_007406 [Zophobas morio]
MFAHFHLNSSRLTQYVLRMFGFLDHKDSLRSKSVHVDSLRFSLDKVENPVRPTKKLSRTHGCAIQTEVKGVNTGQVDKNPHHIVIQY